MSRRTESMPASYFEDLYRAQGDPWQFRTSEYERAKYKETLHVLSRTRYQSALEVGCSIGVFTQMLAARCTHLIALDASAVALNIAREASTGLPNVEFVEGAVPNDMPVGPFELLILSEVLYYLAKADVVETARQSCASVQAGGEIVLCHWLGETDYPLTGDEAADAFLEGASGRGWSHRTLRRPKYRLDQIRTAGD